MRDISIIIPSLNPDEKLAGVVESLIEYGFEDIILVNDGSDEQHTHYFTEMQAKPQCTVLVHEGNKGKGRALKTAFTYCIRERKDIAGVVTVDGDGQHTAADILHCAELMKEQKDKVILGSRDFSGENVPFKSRFGNHMTSFVFKFVCGLSIQDTQTGLRAIPAQYLEEFCRVDGERFEYETNMLLAFKARGLGYQEATIETVYLEDNASTHFHPIRDSIKIYGVIFKYIAGSFSSSVIDLAIFALVQWLLLKIADDRLAVFAATVLARIISSLYNYTFNRKAVFRSNGAVGRTMVRYYILCVCQMLVSWILVWCAKEVFRLGGIMTVIAKALIDTVLFVISFQIQRRWVFSSK